MPDTASRYATLRCVGHQESPGLPCHDSSILTAVRTGTSPQDPAGKVCGVGAGKLAPPAPTPCGNSRPRIRGSHSLGPCRSRAYMSA